MTLASELNVNEEDHPKIELPKTTTAKTVIKATTKNPIVIVIVHQNLGKTATTKITRRNLTTSIAERATRESQTIIEDPVILDIIKDNSVIPATRSLHDAKVIKQDGTVIKLYVRF